MERWLIRCGGAVVLAFLLFEIQSRVFFNRAVDTVEQRIITADAGHPLTAEAVDRLIGGIHSRYDGRPHGQCRLVYRWWSLIQPYALEVLLTPEDVVISLKSDADAIPPEHPNVELEAAPERELRPGFEYPVPGQGFADDGVRTLRASTFDVTLGDRKFPPVDPDLHVFQGVLVREIVRQAFLVSGETELQLLTRDQSLGADTGSSNALKSFAWNIVTRIDQAGTVQIEVNRPYRTRKPTRKVWGPFPLVPGRLYESLAERVEVLSRTEFPAVLREGGHKGEPVEFRAVGVVSLEVEKLLGRMDELSQFAAIRLLHAEIQKDGESPERLGALVRGYANLGSMTEVQWLLHHKVLKARALIYAQRLVALTDSSPQALAHRAYAWALTGRTGSALDDLAALDRTPAATGPALPPWLPVLRAYCEYRPEVLDDPAEPVSLKAYFKLLLASPTVDQQGTIQRAARLLESAPASARVVEVLFQIPSLGIARELAENALASTWPQQYAALVHVPGLPVECREIVARRADGEFGPGEVVDRIRLIRLLNEAPDEQPGLPLAFCGRLVREITFLQSEHLVRVATQGLGIGGDDLVVQLDPIVEGHPYAFYLRALGTTGPELARKHLQDQLAAIPPLELDLTGLALIDLVNHRHSQEAYRRLITHSLMHQDLIERDLLVTTARVPAGEAKAEALRQLEQAAPRLPQTVVAVIRNRPDSVDSHVAEWEARYARNAGVLSELANWYEWRLQLADAKRLLSRLIALVPDHAALRCLAHIYKRQNNRELWRETLDRALEFPAVGLEQAAIHSEIAYDLMQRGQWREALPHANRAADSYSGWGLRCAADCCEGLGDFERAEELVRAISERYSDAAPAWYFWCLRTDRGDLAAARRRAEEELPRLMQLHPTVQFDVATWQRLEGRDAESLGTLERALGRAGDSPFCRAGAILAHRLNKTELRDRMLKKLTQDRNVDEAAAELADVVESWLRHQDEPWDESTFDFRLAYLSLDREPETYFTAAKLLEGGTQPELAQRYLQYAAASRRTTSTSVLLATVELRNAGIAVPAKRSYYGGELAEVDELRNWRNAGDATQVIATADNLLKAKPEFLPALASRASAREQIGDYRQAIADYERALELNPRLVQVQLDLAMLLATCEDDSIRDPQRALQHARQAADLQVTSTYRNHMALAVAYAALGDFDKAIREQENVFQLAPRKAANEARQQMQFFQNHQPYVRPPRKP